MINLFEAEQ